MHGKITDPLAREYFRLLDSRSAQWFKEIKDSKMYLSGDRTDIISLTFDVPEATGICRASQMLLDASNAKSSMVNSLY